MSFPVGGGSVNHESSYPCVVERAAVLGSGSCKWLAAGTFRNSEPINASVAVAVRSQVVDFDNLPMNEFLVSLCVSIRTR